MAGNKTKNQQSSGALVRYLRPVWVPNRAGGFTRTFGLGGSEPWIEQKQHFTSSWHASELDIRGAVVNSTAPRPLDLFEVSVDDGVVKVDAGRMIRRKSCEPGEAVRA